LLPRPWETIEAVDLTGFDLEDFPEITALPARLVALADVLGMTVGRDAAGVAFAAFVGCLCNVAWTPDPDWHRKLGRVETFKFKQWPIVPRLHALRQYALFGRVAVHCEPQYKSRAIGLVIKACSAFIEPASSFWKLDQAKAWLEMAQARRTLKKNQPISREALALLGDVQLAHVQNAISKGDIDLDSARPEKIPAPAALKWLGKGRRYRPSEA